MNGEIIHIWNGLSNRLYQFINQRIRNKQIAKDISQDVFIIVFTKIDSLQNKDKIIPWIYQITRNEINNYFRKQEFGKESKVVNPLETEVNVTEEFSVCMQPMIDNLPLKYREAIRLSEIEGISQKELAIKLDISYSGAKSRVQRGRKMLKTLLQECCTISTDSYGNVMEYKKNEQSNCN